MMNHRQPSSSFVTFEVAYIFILELRYWLESRKSPWILMDYFCGKSISFHQNMVVFGALFIELVNWIESVFDYQI